MDVLRWEGERLLLLDQTELPHRVNYLSCTHYRDVAEAISKLRVRGAPAIGVAAAYGYTLAAYNYRKDQSVSLEQFLHLAAQELLATRPTAVNLLWALQEMDAVFKELQGRELHEIRDGLLAAARRIHNEEWELDKKMASFGVSLVPSCANIITYCNTGALATAGWGTALGVILEAHRQGKKLHVYVPETRPVLQGARLTTWELQQAGVPYTLITDNMIGYVFASKRIDLVLVGADRIVANGDFANKIGTYGLAILADYHNCPFYVAAPFSTIDMGLATGQEIPIELRDPREVREIRDNLIAPADCPVLNPSFDVVPHQLLTALITEKGIFKEPFEESLAIAYREGDE
jgi:methylthioribose-1-phosphate isomerase